MGDDELDRAVEGGLNPENIMRVGIAAADAAVTGLSLFAAGTTAHNAPAVPNAASSIWRSVIFLKFLPLNMLDVC